MKASTLMPVLGMIQAAAAGPYNVRAKRQTDSSTVVTVTVTASPSASPALTLTETVTETMTITPSPSYTTLTVTSFYSPTSSSTGGPPFANTTTPAAGTSTPVSPPFPAFNTSSLYAPTGSTAPYPLSNSSATAGPTGTGAYTFHPSSHPHPTTPPYPSFNWTVPTTAGPSFTGGDRNGTASMVTLTETTPVSATITIPAPSYTEGDRTATSGGPRSYGPPRYPPAHHEGPTEHQDVPEWHGHHGHGQEWKWA